ncbi:MAG: hypothetical protein FJY67_09770 [Calditrichaeota bacterium]|nr:hypothetical protein [Calditrichota bacterium]
MRIQHVCRLSLVMLCGSLLAVGCKTFFEDADYKAGEYWLERGNALQAVRFFKKSVESNPKRWKNHVALLEAIAASESAAEMEAQVKMTLTTFPDSANTASIANPASTLLGDEKYERIAFSYQQQAIGNLLAKQGDKPDLLSRAIIAGCRARDSVAVRNYTRRWLKATTGQALADSVRLEVAFFLGAAWLDWVMLEQRVAATPDDPVLLRERIERGLTAGAFDETGANLKLAASRRSDLLQDADWVRRIALLLGREPFASRTITSGWDGHVAPTGRLYFLKNYGSAESDPYIYALDGGTPAPIMKAHQQNLRAIAWPVVNDDGNWIYFYGSGERDWEPGSGGIFSLYRVRPRWGEDAIRLTTDADLIPVRPHLERDGSLLLLRRDRGSVRASVEVIRLEPASRKLTTVLRIGEPVQAAVFTPNGDTLLFVTSQGVLRRALTGGAVTADLNWSGIKHLILSPDGRWLLLHSGEDHLLLVDRRDPRPIYFGRTPSRYASFHGSKLLITRSEGTTRIVVEYDLSRPIDQRASLAATIEQAAR